MRAAKRPFLLLEVLIGFALVALFATPLIYPHVALLKAERRFLQRMEADRLVQEAFIQLVEEMYMNRIPLEEGEFPLGAFQSELYDFNYEMRVLNSKKGAEEGQIYYELEIKLIRMPKREPEKRESFSYLLFAERKP